MGDRKQYTKSWHEAVSCYREHLARGTKSQSMLLDEEGKRLKDAYSRALFYGVIKNEILIEHIIHVVCAKAPSLKIRALLSLAIAEQIDAGLVNAPKVSHHAVERAKEFFSLPECRFINAVLRKSIPILSEIKARAENQGDIEAMALWHSHPLWLVEKWCQNWGEETAKSLILWNQGIACTYFRVRSMGAMEQYLDHCDSTVWPGFYKIKPGALPFLKPLLDSGDIYIQDPGTRLAPGLLSARPGERVLDLCAAPGGKSLILADQIKGNNQSALVSVDRPGKRIKRLKENLAKIKGVDIECLEKDINDLAKDDFREKGLFDAVLIDVPCSNTGVIRRKPGVKTRLSLNAIQELTHYQYVLLCQAALFVRPGGRLVYSTCSIEVEENREIVNLFLKEHNDFSLQEACCSYPWETGHDGAGCFLLKKRT